MQMLEDALLPEALDDMRKMLKTEIEIDERVFAKQKAAELHERRELAEEQQDRNRFERRRRLALERHGK